MNKNNFIYDILKNEDKKKRFVLSTSAGLYNGQVEIPCLDSLYQDICAYDLVILRNGYLLHGKERIDLDDTYVFLDSVISISSAATEN